MELEKPALDILQPEWKGQGPKNVDMLFTCRDGGVSSGPWGNVDGLMGLNVGDHVGDAEPCVRMNRDIVAQLVPSDPKWLKQVHGNTIVQADTVTADTEADAVWTRTPGVVCAIMVADCLPVLLADKDGEIVAAVHAGWRGLASGLIQSTIAKMTSEMKRPLEIKAWLAPRIGAEAFEVGQDVYDAVTATLPEAREAFVLQPDGEHYLADLGVMAKMALMATGVQEKNIVDCALSTYADAKRFFSYRRDGGKTGRHAALIWIKPKKGASATTPAEAAH